MLIIINLAIPMLITTCLTYLLLLLHSVTLNREKWVLRLPSTINPTPLIIKTIMNWWCFYPCCCTESSSEISSSVALSASPSHFEYNREGNKKSPTKTLSSPVTIWVSRGALQTDCKLFGIALVHLNNVVASSSSWLGWFSILMNEWISSGI